MRVTRSNKCMVGAATAAVLFGSTSIANAALVSGYDIIAAPASVVDDAPGAENLKQQGFDEAQCVQLPRDVAVDGGVIAAGTWVSSHMIFLNTPGHTLAGHFGVDWQFDGDVIGVMSDRGGTLEVASSPLLGAVGTDYPQTAFSARGIEGNNGGTNGGDGYAIAGSAITVSMYVSEPGDWMRVITECNREVVIDIKPGSDPNCFNINGHGVVPVAINGSEAFDATQVDPSTLSFAGLAVNVRGKGQPQCSVEDWNGDGSADMVCQFADDEDAWAPGDGFATLTGATYDGVPFFGTDAICVRP